MSWLQFSEIAKVGGHRVATSNMECIMNGANFRWLLNRSDGVYVDATHGVRRSSLAILNQLNQRTLISFDQDEQALINQLDDSRLNLIPPTLDTFYGFLNTWR